MKTYSKIFLMCLISISIHYSCSSNHSSNSNYGSSYQACQDIRYRIRSLQRTANQAQQAANNSQPGSVAQINFYNTVQNCNQQIAEFQLWLSRNCN